MKQCQNGTQPTDRLQNNLIRLDCLTGILGAALSVRCQISVSVLYKGKSRRSIGQSQLFDLFTRYFAFIFLLAFVFLPLHRHLSQNNYWLLSTVIYCYISSLEIVLFIILANFATNLIKRSITVQFQYVIAVLSTRKEKSIL